MQGEPLHDLLPLVRSRLDACGEVCLIVPDPDLGVGLHAGERLPGGAGRHRPYRVWLDLAERLDADFLTPRTRPDLPDRVELRLRRHGDRAVRTRERHDERYGAASDFVRVDKLEDPCFLDDALEALARIDLPDGARVLDVGVNNGNELRLLDLAAPGHTFDLVGIDVSDSALALARERFPRADLRRLDARDLPAPDLGRFDLIVCLSTLQSPGLDLDTTLRTLRRDHLRPGGSLLLSFPNARYEGGRLTYGARVPNYRRPDLSLLLRDVAHVRRHLQKHGFRVFVTGKYEVFVTAVPIGARVGRSGGASDVGGTIPR